MAFDPQYSTCSFSNFGVPIINKDGNYLQRQYKENFPFLDDEFIRNYIMSSSSPSSRTYSLEEFGVPSGYGSFQECDVSSHNFGHPVYNTVDYYQMEMSKGFEDNKLSGGKGAKYWPDYQPTASENNWEIEEQQRSHKAEDATEKVNRYSAEERREKILKYLKKRHQRNFSKTIKYACRKTLADRRVRVRGRFAKNTQITEYQTLARKNNHCPFQVNDNRYYHHDETYSQMNLSDEEWLQEAIASLRCAPYPCMENNVQG